MVFRRDIVAEDGLASIIEAAIFDAGGGLAAAVLAADLIRKAGWIHRDDIDPSDFIDAAPIERAARDALTGAKDATTRMRHELVFRGARSLDDPENARYFASTVEAMRKVLADLVGPDGGSSDDAAAIVAAIRGASGD